MQPPLLVAFRAKFRPQARQEADIAPRKRPGEPEGGCTQLTQRTQIAQLAQLTQIAQLTPEAPGPCPG